MKQPDTRGLQILLALNRDKRKHIYAGTVPHSKVQARRAKGRQARRSRRINRRRHG